MATDSIAPGMTADRSSSASHTHTTGGDGETCTRPAGDEKKGRTADADQRVVCLKKLLREAPPVYLTLSLTPTGAAAKHRRPKRPVEVSLASVDAPRDYLTLSFTPDDQPRRRRHDMSSGGGGGSAASSVAEGALVVVEAVIPPPPPPPPAQIAATCLPPKKRNLAAAAGVYQETAAGTAPASSSPCLALAIVNRNGGASPSSTSPATMEPHPVDAVPLQAVYVHGGVSRPLTLGSSSAGEITTNEAAAEPEPPAAEGQAEQSRLM